MSQSGAGCRVHGIVINLGASPATWRAECVCGYAGQFHTDRTDAQHDGRDHLYEYQQDDLQPLGIEMIDEGFRLNRLSWMTADEWTYIREQMTAWWQDFLAKEMAR